MPSLYNDFPNNAKYHVNRFKSGKHEKEYEKYDMCWGA